MSDKKKAAKKSAAKKPAAKKAAAKKKAPPQQPKPEYGLPELAKALDVEEATARAKLRTAEIEKDGRYYDFGSKAGLEKVVKQLTAEKKD